MMTMIDFEHIYALLTSQFSGSQKRIDIQSALGVFYGVSPDGYYRLAFMSKDTPPKMESTKLIRVTQGKESAEVNWTCFDLLNHEAKSAFFAFCQNLLEAVENEFNENKALSKLKKRYISWKALFKKGSSAHASKEIVQGLFGELYFLKESMIPTFGPKDSIGAWGGPESTSKDFAINQDWYEVKTIGVTTPCVKISSLAQLSSDVPGTLVVIRVEQMPLRFSNGLSSISEIVAAVLAELEDETLESVFLNKISSFGVDLSDASFATKFDVKSMERYSVVPGFPRITCDEIPYTEITNVTYDISVSAISRFKEEQ